MALKAFEEHGVVPDVTDSAPAAVANVRSLQLSKRKVIELHINPYGVLLIIFSPYFYSQVARCFTCTVPFNTGGVVSCKM